MEEPETDIEFTSSVSSDDSDSEESSSEEDWDPPEAPPLDVPLDILTRQAWNARPPKEETPLPHPVHHTLLSYANIDPCTNRQECIVAMQKLQNKHMDEDNMPDIQYNFYISQDLTVYEGRGWHTASTERFKYYKDMEKRKFDLCYLGRIAEDDNYPDVEVMQVRDQLMKYGINAGYLHEDFNTLHVLP